jgi:hypothetical protein
VKLHLYCLCGASVHWRDSERNCTVVRERFWAEHSGPGHGPTTREKASAARRKDLREWRKGSVADGK